MKHTDWCGRGHLCVLGEHRSEPFALPTPYGGLILTHVATERAEWVEVRASVPLPTDDRRSRDVLVQLAAALDLSIRSVLAGDVEALQPMIERVRLVR